MYACSVEVGVKYVNDGEVGWTPVVRSRRKKSARSEDSDSSGNLNVMVDLKRRCLVWHKKVERLLEFMFVDISSFKMVAEKSSPISLRTKY